MARNEKLELVISAKDAASSVITGVQGKIVGLAAAFVSVTAVTGFLKDSANAALESERALHKLSQSLSSAGYDATALVPQFEELANQFQRTTRFTDELALEGYAKLARAGFNLTQQQQLLNQAADIAVLTDQDLLSVVDSMIKGFSGMDRQLRAIAASFGVMVTQGDNAETLLAKINEHTKDARVEDMGDYARALNDISDALDTLKENVGGPALEAFAFTLKGIAVLSITVSETWDKLLFQFGEITSEEYTKRLVDHAIALNRVTSEATTGAEAIKKLGGEHNALGKAAKESEEARAAALKAEQAELDKIHARIETVTQMYGDFRPGEGLLLGNEPTVIDEQFDALLTKSNELAEQHQANIREILRANLRATTEIEEDWANTTGFMMSQMSSFAGAVTAGLFHGADAAKEAFSRMAEHFMQYFIEQALFTLVATFIPGLQQTLFGIFDKPYNDRKAAEQGQHFMQWFQRGALAEAAGLGNSLALAGAGMMGAPLSSQGTVVNHHYHFNGVTMTSSDFVKSVVAPQLQTMTRRNEVKLHPPAKTKRNAGSESVKD